eukprot:8287764-Karenia_brevis.AAC.1
MEEEKDRIAALKLEKKRLLEMLVDVGPPQDQMKFMMYCFQAGLPAAQAKAWFESEYPRSKESAREDPFTLPARVEPPATMEDTPDGFCMPSNF